MSIKALFNHETDTVVEKPIKIPFSFDNKESLPKGKEVGDCIVIKPITVRTWFKMRPLLLLIDEEDIEKMIIQQGEVTSEFAAIMDKYGELLLDVVCLGIHNKPTDPPEWFKGVLKDNCTWEDIRILLNAILYRIGQFPFYTSITTLANVSPVSETEIIAAQKNLRSWQAPVKQDS